MTRLPHKITHRNRRTWRAPPVRHAWERVRYRRAAVLFNVNSYGIGARP